MKIADYLSEHQFKELGQIANKSRIYEKKNEMPQAIGPEAAAAGAAPLFPAQKPASAIFYPHFL